MNKTRRIVCASYTLHATSRTQIRKECTDNGIDTLISDFCGLEGSRPPCAHIKTEQADD